MMNFLFTDEHRILTKNVAELCRREFAGLAAEIDQTASFPWDNFKKLASHGFTAMNVPEDFGGSGADILSFVLAIEEIAKSCGSTALVLLAHHFVTQGLTLAGNPEQKARFLPLLARGEKLGAFAVHEPNSGCVHSAIETRASKENGSYLVNGSKFFITSAGEADLYLTLVITDKSKGPEGLSLLLAQKDTVGMTFGKKYERLGFRGTSGRDIYFENCRVPSENLVGKEGEGLKLLGAIGGKFAMLGAAAISLGIAEAAYEASVGHAKQRTIAGKSLAEHQSIRFTITEMSLLINAAQSFLYSAATGSGTPPMPSPPWTLQAKLFASEIAVEVTNKALQIHGGHGYCSDLPIERYLRDARGLTFHFGTTELLKDNVAGAIFERLQ
jgi:alkylation response protein AidB-like acyl-CoA dehydrogenase